MKIMRKTITSIVSIGIFAFTLSFASCDFMAGMAAGAAYGLANTAYYYPSYSNTSYYSGSTSSSSSSSTSANVWIQYNHIKLQNHAVFVMALANAILAMEDIGIMGILATR